MKESERLIRKAESRHGYAKQMATESKKELIAAKIHWKACCEAQRHIQKIAQGVQQVAHTQICGLVTKCLSAVYQEEAYSFSIKVERKRGKTEVKFVFTRDGEDFDSPVGECGMGTVEVANFALTLAEIVLTGKRRLLILDEPFRGIHGDGNRERLAALLPRMCEELGFQVLLCTGNPWLEAAGKIIEIKK